MKKPVKGKRFKTYDPEGTGYFIEGTLWDDGLWDDGLWDDGTMVIMSEGNDRGNEPSWLAEYD